MRKVKFYIETGYCGVDISEICEYEDDVTEREIEEDLNEWRDNAISWGWEDV